jgi:hypothetical protein
VSDNARILYSLPHMPETVPFRYVFLFILSCTAVPIICEQLLNRYVLDEKNIVERQMRCKLVLSRNKIKKGLLAFVYVNHEIAIFIIL